MDVITCIVYFTVPYTYMDILVCVHVEYENIGHEKGRLVMRRIGFLTADIMTWQTSVTVKYGLISFKCGHLRAPALFMLAYRMAQWNWDISNVTSYTCVLMRFGINLIN